MKENHFITYGVNEDIFFFYIQYHSQRNLYKLTKQTFNTFYKLLRVLFNFVILLCLYSKTFLVQ